jgi:8-oxo-dGTP pyrophosphatase MutT (NUDIX family)
MTTKPSVGVVIGRFQCYKLTEGHVILIDKAAEHSKLLICIGIGKVLGTPRDPLDYQAREQMIKEKYPQAVVIPLNDQPTDELWTKQLNSLIHIMFPTDKATIYCGRPDGSSSIQSGYHGPHKVVEIEEIPNVSATDLRQQVGRSVEASEAFRRGVIYGATNQFTRIDPVVDICVWKQSLSKKLTKILLGRRHNEGGTFRLPGGHIDAKDINGEAAARRELLEETGLTAENWQIIENIRINTKSGDGYAMFSTLYLAKYSCGVAQGNDDLDDCQWFDIDHIERNINTLKFADNHKELIQIAIKTLRERQE